MILWFVGLSGAGKSTLGKEVYNQLRMIAPNTVFLDGDTLRQVFDHDKGESPYSLEGRRLNAERITALCEMLDKQGMNVVCCILSIFPEMRKDNKNRFSDYFEVFMDAPLDVLIERDVKGLYAAALKGEMKNVVGLDITFIPPDESDIIIDSSKDKPDIRSLAHTVLKAASLI